MPEEEPDERDAMIEQLMQQGEVQQGKINQLSQGLSMYDQSTPSSNLVHFQIDCSDLLERLEHFYRGEYLGSDDEGNISWKKPSDHEQVPLNDLGVSSYMEIISKYIDKNTILSNYNEMRINEIIADLGDELIKFTYCNYENIGMNTAFKKAKFPLLIMTTLNIIENTYRRSIRGKTFEDINQSRIITQSDSLGLRNMFPMQSQSHKKKSGFRSFFGL